jgi:hypothetical protein
MANILRLKIKWRHLISSFVQSNVLLMTVLCARAESKFVSVLAGPLRAVVGLSGAEIAQVADYFRAQDGRVLYHQLCQIIHGEGERDTTHNIYYLDVKNYLIC